MKKAYSAFKNKARMLNAKVHVLVSAFNLREFTFIFQPKNFRNVLCCDDDHLYPRYLFL